MVCLNSARLLGNSDKTTEKPRNPRFVFFGRKSNEWFSGSVFRLIEINNCNRMASSVKFATDTNSMVNDGQCTEVYYCVRMFLRILLVVFFCFGCVALCSESHAESLVFIANVVRGICVWLCEWAFRIV